MKAIITKFYEAFDRLDAAAMAACYHPEVVFEDPAFGRLQGKKAAEMWAMLCESQKGKDFRITYQDIQSEDNAGSAHWEAFYTFSKTGRKVHNKIDAQFRFQDGLIISHTDHFNLRRWAAQAMGFKGWLLGGTDFFRKKMQAQTNHLLDKFQEKS